MRNKTNGTCDGSELLIIITTMAKKATSRFRNKRVRLDTVEEMHTRQPLAQLHCHHKVPLVAVVVVVVLAVVEIVTTVSSSSSRMQE